MNETQKQLEEMTKDFLSDLRGSSSEIDDERLRTNFESYLSDAEHFLSEKDYIRSFEAAVFASGLLESRTRLSSGEQF